MEQGMIVPDKACRREFMREYRWYHGFLSSSYNLGRAFYFVKNNGEDIPMKLIERYLERTEFTSYEDFLENYRLVIPESFDFARDVVDEWARMEPEKLALIYCNDENEERYFTFTEISLLSKKAASYFLSIGIKAGDRVITMLRRRWEYWVAAVALHRIGAVVVPVSIQMETKDIIYRANSCSAKAIIAVNDEFVISQMEAARHDCHTVKNIIIAGEKREGYPYFDEEMEKSAPYEGFSDLKNEDDMIIYFTSGTTGYPKQAIHNRLYPIGHIITAKYLQQVEDNGLHITQADSGWAKFGWGNIYGQWLCGTAMLAYDPEKFRAKNFVNAIKKYKPVTVCVPPTIYRMMLRDGFTKEDMASVKVFVSAGESLTREVNQAFYDIVGKYIREGYGQSEGTPIFGNWKYIDLKLSSMGKISPLYDLKIIDKSGKECNTGETGEIVLIPKYEHIGLLKTYFYEGKEHNVLRNGIYHTGDEAYLDEDGYGWYLGRNDDIIKSSGYRIGPYEIESVLNTHPAVKESAIIGLPDEIRGQVVCAVVVLNNECGDRQAMIEELKEYVKTNTAPYKYPRVVKFTEELPKTTSGKLMRGKVREDVLSARL
ncbi:MAG TPA: AMP-binding protein [Clostridia bacterium]|nr:AMP-binding protein [Clostridia bacterium]